MWKTLRTSWDLLLDVDPAFLAAMLALYTASLFFVGARWKLMIEALGGRAGLWTTTVTNLGGIFVNNTMPATRLGGEAFRIAMIRRRGAIDLRVAGISSVYDRLTEIPPVLVLAVLALPALHRMSARVDRAVAIGTGAFLLVGALFLLNRTLPRLRERLRALLARLASVRIPPRTILAGVGWSSLVWLQDIVRLTVAATAFGVTLTPSEASTLAVLTILGGLVPTIGGLGAVEGGLVAGLVFCGISLDSAIAITALERSVSYVFGTCAGGLAVLGLGGKRIWNVSRSHS